MKTKSYGLDIIRIISSLLVFIPHIFISFAENKYVVKNAYVISAIGVELFFCLSGYLICKIGLEVIRSEKNIFLNAGVFIIRRIGRTWPAYFFALLSYIIFYKFFEKEILYYIFFAQNLYFPMVSENFFEVSWSICVEEAFYIIFPLVLCLITFSIRYCLNLDFKPSTFIIISSILIMFTVFLLREFHIYLEWGRELRRTSLFRIDAIAFGGLGYFFMSYVKKIKILNSLLLISALLSFMIAYNELYQYSLNAKFNNTGLEKNYIFYIIYFFSLSIIGYADRKILTTSSFLKTKISEIANLSYPLYLMHILVIDFTKSFGINNQILNISIIFLLSLGTALFIRRHIEEPFIRVRPRFFK